MTGAAIRAFACSPRAGGNTDMMAHHFVRGVHAAGGSAEVTHLRDYTVLPCTACRCCAEETGAGCPLAGRDDAEILFRRIEEAPLVCILAPIFFYHVPAQLKCLIDRAQQYWERRRRQGAPPSVRPGLVGLVAARRRGEKLFEGSMLTLKYFFELFGIRAVDGCRLRGYEQPDDLARDEAACARLYEMGVQAAALAAERSGQA
jgi:multimeric flavodoxin WrbA